MPLNLRSNLILTFEADGNIMRRPSRFFPLECRDMWRPVTPVAAHPATGDDVHVEVRGVLSCYDSVILNEIQSFRIVRSDESVGHPSHGPYDSDCLFVRQIKESWGVTSGDDVDLAMLKLFPVDHCQSLLGLLDDPLVLASGNCLAQEAWIAKSRLSPPTSSAGVGRYLNGQCKLPSVWTARNSPNSVVVRRMSRALPVYTSTGVFVAEACCSSAW